jgi:FdrA protein
MSDRVIVRRGAYHDSVTLMLVSREAAAEEGAESVSVAMATPLNVDLIASQGFELPDDLAPNDLVIAVRASDGEAVLAAVERALARRETGGERDERPAPRSLTAAARRRPELSVAFLSVPGRHVAYEAAAAVEAGLHVFCFSDGLALDQEAALKRRAIERGLLFMGADCGTAIVDGVALGFANAVQRGPVGIVGASGTGTQEVCCLLDAAGIGVSHAIGVGGRDLRAEIGGTMFRRGLELLAGDEGTEVIVAISKPPDPEVAAAISETAAQAGKPVVMALLGVEGTLEQAAARAAQLAGGALPEFGETAARSPGYIRGLYCGGTLCDEAMMIASERVGEVASNIPLRPEWRLESVHESRGHTFVDFGEDELTEGRAHPMIDPSLRTERLRREAADPEVGVVLLDVVLGYGAHPDPAEELAPAIAAADAQVIVALCGAARDPQDLEAQRRRLEEAGAVVTRSNAHAARMAVAAATAGAARSDEVDAQEARRGE